MEPQSPLDALPEVLEPARATLVRAPVLHPARDPVCGALLPSAAPVGLGVCYRASPDDWLDRFERHAEGAATVVAATGAPENAGRAVRSLESPADLTGLGIAVGEALGESGGAVVCFDSLTALLQYVDPDRAYQFLHALVGRLSMADARAHFHVDPEAHDEATLSALASVCDAVVEVGGGAEGARGGAVAGPADGRGVAGGEGPGGADVDGPCGSDGADRDGVYDLAAEAGTLTVRLRPGLDE